MLTIMAAGTSYLAAVGLLAGDLVDSLGISHAGLGLALGIPSLVGAVCSPYAGILSDRIGPDRAAVVVFSTCGVAFLLMASAGDARLLFLGAGLSGIAGAFTNPATNMLIASELPTHMHATGIGLKQSGVYAGATIMGMLLPGAAAMWGWRASAFLTASVWLTFLLYRVYAPDRQASRPRRGKNSRGTLAQLWPLSVYAANMGVSSAFMFLLPIYSQDVLGFDLVRAGRVSVVCAVAAVIGRLVWARRAEQLVAFASLLRLIALVGVASVGLVGMSTAVEWFLWPGALVMGASIGSWNSVGMLAAMTTVTGNRLGSASGWVQFGFLVGSGLGASLLGLIIDGSRSYMPALFVVAGTSALASASTIWECRSVTDSGEPK